VELIQALGFEPTDKVVVVHVDDVGCCSAANRGWERSSADAATAGSVMVPCPGFGEIGDYVARSPGTDLGVHLTLNCEYASERWGPVRDDVPSLCAADGGMWPTSAETVEHADPEQVARELRAQIETALERGIDVTHLDVHMGTLFHLRFVEIYLELAREFRLPMFLPRVDREQLRAAGMPDEIDRYLSLLDRAERDGFPLFDHFDMNSLHFEPGTGLAHNRSRFDGLGSGLSYLITHCAEATDRFGGLSGGEQRVEECEIYSNGSMSHYLAEHGIHTIGMRALRELLRARLPV